MRSEGGRREQDIGSAEALETRMRGIEVLTCRFGIRSAISINYLLDRLSLEHAVPSKHRRMYVLRRRFYGRNTSFDLPAWSLTPNPFL